MKLQRLKIENYRGLKELDLELDDITVLIGENNTGKTSVLDVLQTCLWALRSRRSEAFDPYDFHLGNAAAEPRDAPPVLVTLTFSEQQKGVRPAERTEVGGLTATG